MLYFRLATLLFVLSLAPPALADVRTETAARQAMIKAQKDFASARYGAGLARLRTALKKCGTTRCSDEVRAELLGDLGAFQFRKGDKRGSKKSWSSALKLDPNLALSGAYDSPDVAQAFEDARGTRGGQPRETARATPPASTGAPTESGGDQGPSKSGPEASADREREGGADSPSTSDTEPKPAEEGGASAKHLRRIWIGVSGTIDFAHLPVGQDVCKLDATGHPFNTGDYYCTYDSGADFPSRNPNNPTNAALQQGQAGHVSDQITTGNARLLLSFDYALSENVLMGVRAGVTSFTYPGGSPTAGTNETSGAAFRDGKAFSPAWLHLELRATYLFGDDPLSRLGLAPMAFVGGGLAEFDQHVSDNVALSDGLSGPVRIWRTAGPLFLLGGAGLRWGLSENFALTAAIRANLAVTPLFVPTIGPEVGFQYGL